MALQVEIRSAVLPPLPVDTTGGDGAPSFWLRFLKPDVRVNGVSVYAPAGVPGAWNPLPLVVAGAGILAVLYLAWRGLR